MSLIFYLFFPRSFLNFFHSETYFVSREKLNPTLVEFHTSRLMKTISRLGVDKGIAKSRQKNCVARPFAIDCLLVGD